MVRIRQINFLDVFHLKKMMFFVSDDKPVLPFRNSVDLILCYIQKFLPVRFKRFADSYVACDGNELLGMICLRPQKGNPYKWKIIQLFLSENAYDAGRLLIDFVVAKYGACGVNTFFVKVDENHEELIELFTKGCGFRSCASEELWKLTKIPQCEKKESQTSFRPFKNSDSEAVNELNTDAITPYYKFSLTKAKQEFEDPVITTSNQPLTIKFVLQDNNSKRICAYFAIMTENNQDYILDAIIAQPYYEFLQDIFAFSINQIMKRTKDFSLMMLNRKYLYSQEFFKEFLTSNNFERIQNRVVLVKDFFKRVKDSSMEKQSAIVFSNISTKPAFKKIDL